MRPKNNLNIKGPNVIVPGFPRSASTFLYLALRQHPDIFIPTQKEIHYFNKTHYYLGYPRRTNPNFKKNFKWYTDKFNSPKKVKIDFSICTSYDLDSAKRVKKNFPNIKVIFITREQRGHKKSMYKLLKLIGDIPNISYEKYEKKYPALLELSNFKKYIIPWKKEFENIFITSLEEIRENPEKIMKKVTKFLEIEDYTFNFNLKKNTYNNYKYSEIRRVLKLISIFVSWLGLTRFSHFFLRDRVIGRMTHGGE